MKIRFSDVHHGAEDWHSKYFRRNFNGGEKDYIYTRDKGRCRYCGRKVPRKKAQFDHVKPWSKGWPTTVRNGALACHPCNIKKHAKTDAGVNVAGQFFRRVHKEGAMGPENWGDYFKDHDPIGALLKGKTSPRVKLDIPVDRV